MSGPPAPPRPSCSSCPRLARVSGLPARSGPALSPPRRLRQISGHASALPCPPGPSDEATAPSLKLLPASDTTAPGSSAPARGSSELRPGPVTRLHGMQTLCLCHRSASSEGWSVFPTATRPYPPPLVTFEGTCALPQKALLQTPLFHPRDVISHQLSHQNLEKHSWFPPSPSLPPSTDSIHKTVRNLPHPSICPASTW